MSSLKLGRGMEELRKVESRLREQCKGRKKRFNNPYASRPSENPPISLSVPTGGVQFRQANIIDQAKIEASNTNEEEWHDAIEEEWHDDIEEKNINEPTMDNVTAARVDCIPSTKVFWRKIWRQKANDSWRKIWRRTANSSILTGQLGWQSSTSNFSPPSVDDRLVVLSGEISNGDEVRGAKKRMLEDMESHRPEEIESECIKSDVDAVRATKRLRLEDMESLSEAGTSSPVQFPTTSPVDLEPLDDTVVREEEEEDDKAQLLNNNVDRRLWPCPRCKFINDGDAGYCENMVDGKRCCSGHGPSTTIGWAGTQLANPEHLSWNRNGFLSLEQIQSLNKSSKVRSASEAGNASPVPSPATPSVVLEPLVDTAITTSASPGQTPATTATSSTFLFGTTEVVWRKIWRRKANGSWRKIWKRRANASLLMGRLGWESSTRNFSSPYADDEVRGAKKRMLEEGMESHRPLTKRPRLEEDMELLSEAGTSSPVQFPTTSPVDLEPLDDTVVTEQEEDDDDNISLLLGVDFAPSDLNDKSLTYSDSENEYDLEDDHKSEVDEIRGAKKHMREEDMEFGPEEIESAGDKSEVVVVRVTKRLKTTHEDNNSGDEVEEAVWSSSDSSSYYVNEEELATPEETTTTTTTMTMTAAVATVAAITPAETITTTIATPTTIAATRDMATTPEETMASAATTTTIDEDVSESGGESVADRKRCRLMRELDSSLDGRYWRTPVRRESKWTCRN